jgi:arylsulfatase A-like enzyme
VLFRECLHGGGFVQSLAHGDLQRLPPHRSGLYQNLQKMREVMPEAELLPRYFSRHGYWSAGSGKMLHYIIDPPSGMITFRTKRRTIPSLARFIPKRPVNLPRAGDWQYVETDWAALDVTDEEFGGDWLVTKWIGEQLQRPHDKPFFLACGLYRPHEPWFVPKKYFEPFPLESIQLPPGYKADDLDDCRPQVSARAESLLRAHPEARAVEKGHPGLSRVDSLRRCHARSRAGCARKSPQRDNTIVVLWSDHGWHLGEKEHWQKFTGWRVCDRVPLMVRVPKGAPVCPKARTPAACVIVW